MTVHELELDAFATPGRDEARRWRSWWAVIRLGARKYPVYAVGAVVFGLSLLVAISGPYLPLANPEDQALGDRLLGPFERGSSGTWHVAGTDNLGRDILARTVHGARISIGIATATALIAGAVGTMVGVAAGYRGGLLDLAVMRLVDLQMAFPGLVLAIFMLYVLGPSVANLVLLLVIFSWAVFARLARAQTLSLRAQPFVEGAVCVGASDTRIVFFHVVPHLIPVVATVAVFDFASVMLAEAGLSYLGLGVQPPGISWGLMLSEGKEYVYTGGWWLFLLPGIALSITTLSANLTSRWMQHLFRVQE